MHSIGNARGSVCFAWIALAGLGLGVMLGCSSGKKGDPNGRVVTGKVTYQGNPVEGALLTFNSQSNQAFGQTDAEGKYKLAVSSGDKVPLGVYQVSIVKKEQPATPAAGADFDPEHPENYEFVPPDPNAPPPAEPKDLLPVKYANAAESGLSATVTADGKNEFDFALAD